MSVDPKEPHPFDFVEPILKLRKVSLTLHRLRFDAAEFDLFRFDLWGSQPTAQADSQHHAKN